MSRSVMISGAHLDSLTQEPLCDSPSNCNHTLLMPHPPRTPTTGLFSLFPSAFPTAISVLQLPSSFSSFPHAPFTASSLFPTPNATTYTSFPPTPGASLPLWTSPFHLPLPASADCLQVSCGHFSFITLSKSGMALAQGDWVSVKHQDLIEFVLKWVIEGTMLMQSWGARQVSRFRSFSPQHAAC